MLEATIATSNLNIVVANKCQNSDLWWIICDGCNTFSVSVDVTAKARLEPSRRFVH